MGRRWSTPGCSHHRLIRGPPPCVFVPRLRDSGTPVARPSGARRSAGRARWVLPASAYHALRLRCAGAAGGHEGGATWVTVPIAIVALGRDAGRTAALATRLSARRPPPPPGRGDGLASAAGFVGGHGTGGRRRLRGADPRRQRRAASASQHARHSVHAGGSAPAGHRARAMPRIGAAVRPRGIKIRPRTAGRRRAPHPGHGVPQ
jgi:hypothetical protein